MVLLYALFNSLRDSLLSIAGIPFAVASGILAATGMLRVLNSRYFVARGTRQVRTDDGDEDIEIDWLSDVVVGAQLPPLKLVLAVG